MFRLLGKDDETEENIKDAYIILANVNISWTFAENPLLLSRELQHAKQIPLKSTKECRKNQEESVLLSERSEFIRDLIFPND